MLTLADGQLATTATALGTQGSWPIANAPQPQPWGNPVNVSLLNTSGANTETILVFVQRGSNNTTTNRRVARFVLSPNEQGFITSLVLGPADVILAQTTDGTTVDYLISEGMPGPLNVFTLDSKGQIKQTNGTSITGATTLTSTSANALSVGANGATNPVFNVNAATSSVATGVQVTGAAAGSGVALLVISSGTNEAATIDTKGTGTLGLQTVSGTGNVLCGTGLLVNASVTAGGVGYGTGAGGTVAQGTSRTTGVTLSKLSGTITLVSAAGSATAFTMTVTNTLVAATDSIIVSQKSGTDAYQAVVSAVGAGSFKLTITDLTGTTTETPAFNVQVIKGVAA